MSDTSTSQERIVIRAPSITIGGDNDPLKLPPPGLYPATVERVTVADGREALRLGIDYLLDPPADCLVEDWITVAADPGSRAANFLVDGSRRLLRLAEVTSFTLPTDGDPECIVAALLGRSLVVDVAHRDGDLRARRLLPPGTTETPT